MLNRKVKETLASGWKEWLAQAAELQVLRADAESPKKEDHGFYKMDKNSIQMVWEDVTKDFQALAKTHTTTIESLLEEFNNDQLLIMLETK